MLPAVLQPAFAVVLKIPLGRETAASGRWPGRPVLHRVRNVRSGPAAANARITASLAASCRVVYADVVFTPSGR